MTEEEAVVAMHKVLAEYHAALAKDTRDVVHDYHDDLAFRLAHEAERIPERGARTE